LPEVSLPSAGSWELVAWEAGGWLLGGPGGQHRRAFTPKHRNRAAGLGVLDDQGQGDAEDGPEQRGHDDQELAEPAKRSIHRASKVERTLCTLPKPQEPKPDHGRSQLAAGYYCC
jgi:hypothetical protein